MNEYFSEDKINKDCCVDNKSADFQVKSKKELEGQESLEYIMQEAINKHVDKKREIDSNLISYKNNMQVLMANEGNNVQFLSRLFNNVFIRWDGSFKKIKSFFTKTD